MTDITRRSMLGGMAAVAVPTTASSQPAIDTFLSKATPAEKATYFANALAEVMGEMHPDHFFVSHVRHDLNLSMVIGHPREARS